MPGTKVGILIEEVFSGRREGVASCNYVKVKGYQMSVCIETKSGINSVPSNKHPFKSKIQIYIYMLEDVFVQHEKMAPNVSREIHIACLFRISTESGNTQKKIEKPPLQRTETTRVPKQLNILRGISS